MARRLALAVLCVLSLIPTAHRRFAGHAVDPVPCTPAGRGIPPRHWIGCEGDPGPRRDLTGLERWMSGVPIALEDATPEDLAVVPGLSPRLAIEVVRERTLRGPFQSVDDLMRVRGIGRGRLDRARPFLSVAH